MQLHVIGPWCYAIVPPEGIPAIALAEIIQPGPMSHPGVPTICSDDPPSFDRSTSNLDALFGDTRHRRLPHEINSQTRGSLGNQRMQNGPPYTSSRGPIRKRRFHGESCTYKTNPKKRGGIAVFHKNAKSPKRRETIGHQSFTAWFVDRHLNAIGNYYAKSPLTGRNRGR